MTNRNWVLKANLRLRIWESSGMCGGFTEVSEISMRWWSNSVACRSQQAQLMWIWHSVPNHPRDQTRWIRAELPWHVLVFVQNITRINIFLSKSEYDPLFRVQGVVALTAPQMKQKHFVDEQQQKLEITTKNITQK